MEAGQSPELCLVRPLKRGVPVQHRGGGPCPAYQQTSETAEQNWCAEGPGCLSYRWGH